MPRREHVRCFSLNDRESVHVLPGFLIGLMAGPDTDGRYDWLER